MCALLYVRWCVNVCMLVYVLACVCVCVRACVCVVPVNHIYSFKVAMKTRHEQFINLDFVKCMYINASTANRRKIVLLLSLKPLIGEN